MIEEEKAEEYLRCKWSCGSYDRTNKRCIYKNRCISYQIYLDGLRANRNDLEKENARLSKMLEMAINDTIRKGNQCFYCKDNYTKDICDNCTEENRINVMKLYREELEKRVENEKKTNEEERESKAKIYSEIWGHDENSKKLAKMAWRDGFLEGEKSAAYTNEKIKELEETNLLQKKELEFVQKGKSELQYKLKCRDDELAEANARIHQLTQEAQAREATLNQKLRRTETKLKLAAQDYLDTKPAWFYGYGDELEERAKKQEELEDLCREDKMALIKMEEEINGEE